MQSKFILTSMEVVLPFSFATKVFDLPTNNIVTGFLCPQPPVYISLSEIPCLASKTALKPSVATLSSVSASSRWVL